MGGGEGSVFNQSGVWELEVDIGMSLTVYQPSVLSQSLLLSLDLTISARLAGQGAPRDPPATTSQHWDHRQVSSPLGWTWTLGCEVRSSGLHSQYLSRALSPGFIGLHGFQCDVYILNWTETHRRVRWNVGGWEG